MDSRFERSEGLEVFNGNELVIKGALEAGVSLITGYPGSPVADVFDVAHSIRDLLLKKGVLAQMANNEALSIARLNGAQMADIRAIAVMKSVGLHVAADGLALGNLSKTGHRGGALVVVGDDPWTDSTQVPADSRFLAKHLQLPILEPSSFQEIKDWMRLGLDLSKESNLYLLYLLTTNQADGGAIVETYPNQYPRINFLNPFELDTRKIPVDDTVLLPPRTGRREEELQHRFRLLLNSCRAKKLNTILYPSSHISEFGFVSSGLAFSYLEQALWDLELQGKFPILKLGLTYPLDTEILMDFACQVKNIIVIEEKRSFIEDEITSMIKDVVQKGDFKGGVQIWGKTFPMNLSGIPSVRGLHPSILIDRIGRLMLQENHLASNCTHIEKELALLKEVESISLTIPARTPTFCPGCPHRDSSSVFLDIKKSFRDASYMKKKHRASPVDLLFHGDTGCYTMLMFEPNQELMHNYSGMGLGGGTGAGIDPFITNKQVVFMGDSTFFHSGVAAISDSIKNRQNIAYIILDNKTTAMTGHQPTPGTDVDILGRPTFAQDIEKVLKGMTADTCFSVVRVNPEERMSYRAILETMILKDGVKVIIADKECGITYHRRVRQEKAKIFREKGYLPKEEFVNITPEVCEYCLECTRLTGCPGLTIEDTDNGPKIVTDLSACVADMACTKIKACPSFEKIEIHRSRKSKDRLESLDLIHFEEPRPWRLLDEWHVYISGVGGMGIGILTSILVRSGMREGYYVQFCDKKGLAIRNGGVYSSITFTKGPVKTSPVIPNGKADLLWGLDILEAARALDPKMHLRVGSPQYTTSFINTHKTQTIRGLMGLDQFSSAQLEVFLKDHTRRESYFSLDFSSISESYLGSKLYVNLVMLGAAYQQARLPFRYDSIIGGIQDTIQGGFKRNMMAFNLGRRIASSTGDFSPLASKGTFQTLFEEKENLLRKGVLGSGKIAQGYHEMVQGALSQLILEDELMRHFALKVYDLICYENPAYAKDYINRVLSIYQKDRMQRRYAATRAVIYNLAKVMLIKDEVYVAHLLTSPEKTARDMARYGVDPKRGDRMIYRHINRPQFNIAGFAFEFDMETRNWQLQIMKRMKFLRRWLPLWHQKEKEFRTWYNSLVDQFHFTDDASYQLYVQALQTPEEVRGYREIRYPKMEDAKIRVSELLGIHIGEKPRSPLVAKPSATKVSR